MNANISDISDIPANANVPANQANATLSDSDYSDCDYCCQYYNYHDPRYNPNEEHNEDQDENNNNNNNDKDNNNNNDKDNNNNDEVNKDCEDNAYYKECYKITKRSNGSNRRGNSKHPKTYKDGYFYDFVLLLDNIQVIDADPSLDDLYEMLDLIPFDETKITNVSSYIYSSMLSNGLISFNMSHVPLCMVLAPLSYLDNPIDPNSVIYSLSWNGHDPNERMILKYGLQHGEHSVFYLWIPIHKVAMFLHDHGFHQLEIEWNSCLFSYFYTEMYYRQDRGKRYSASYKTVVNSVDIRLAYAYQLVASCMKPNKKFDILRFISLVLPYKKAQKVYRWLLWGTFKCLFDSDNEIEYITPLIKTEDHDDLFDMIDDRIIVSTIKETEYKFPDEPADPYDCEDRYGLSLYRSDKGKWGLEMDPAKLFNFLDDYPIPMVFKDVWILMNTDLPICAPDIEAPYIPIYPDDYSSDDGFADEYERKINTKPDLANRFGPDCPTLDALYRKICRQPKDFIYSYVYSDTGFITTFARHKAYFRDPREFIRSYVVNASIKNLASLLEPRNLYQRHYQIKAYGVQREYIEICLQAYRSYIPLERCGYTRCRRDKYIPTIYDFSTEDQIGILNPFLRYSHHKYDHCLGYDYWIDIAKSYNFDINRYFIWQISFQDTHFLLVARRCKQDNRLYVRGSSLPSPLKCKIDDLPLLNALCLIAAVDKQWYKNVEKTEIRKYHHLLRHYINAYKIVIYCKDKIHDDEAKALADDYIKRLDGLYKIQQEKEDEKKKTLKKGDKYSRKNERWPVFYHDEIDINDFYPNYDFEYFSDTDEDPENDGDHEKDYEFYCEQYSYKEECETDEDSEWVEYCKELIEDEINEEKELNEENESDNENDNDNDNEDNDDE